MTNRTPDDYLRLTQRISTVLNWHSKGKRNLCAECGQVYPCRTRLMFLGRESDAAGSVPLRLPRPP